MKGHGNLLWTVLRAVMLACALVMGCSQTIPGPARDSSSTDGPDRSDLGPSDATDDRPPPDTGNDRPDAQAGPCEERPSAAVEMATPFENFGYVRTAGGCAWRWWGPPNVRPFGLVPEMGMLRSMSVYRLFCGVSAGTARCIAEAPNVLPPIANIPNATKVVAGIAGMCAMVTSGEVLCSGRLGYPSPQAIHHALPSPVEGLEGTVDIGKLVAGVFAAMMNDGSVRLWNYTDTRVLRATPFPVYDGATSFSGSERHVCARMRDGTVKCAGDNISYVCGTTEGTFYSLDRPQTISGLSDILQVAGAHELAEYALRADGRLLRWGWVRRYTRDRLGTNTPTPELVPDLTDVVQIGGGTGDLLALRRDGSLWSLHLPSDDGVPALSRIPGFGPP